MIDDDDMCPDTAGADVDFFGCSDEQNGNSGGATMAEATEVALVEVESILAVFQPVQTNRQL